jgi:ribose-phosphate pyrophosphokinase
VYPDADNLRLFAGRRHRDLAQRVCDHLDLPLCDAKTEVFPDGELIVRVNNDVRGRDCYVILSTDEPVNDNLMELLIFIDCLRRASAKRITAVIPYFGYARQDRKDEGRVPITAKLVANLIANSGADRVLAIDLHTAQIQGFFDILVDHLSAMPVFVDELRSRRDELGELVLVSPDVGNVKVANRYADELEGELAIIHKRRTGSDSVAAVNIVGDVQNKTVLMMDDMISTAGTICSAAEVVMERGAKRVLAGATHGLLVGPAAERLASSPISEILITDTIPERPDRLAPIADKITRLSVGSLLGEAIDRVHRNRSVSAMFRSAASKR